MIQPGNREATETNPARASSEAGTAAPPESAPCAAGAGPGGGSERTGGGSERTGGGSERTGGGGPDSSATVRPGSAPASSPATGEAAGKETGEAAGRATGEATAQAGGGAPSASAARPAPATPAVADAAAAVPPPSGEAPLAPAAARPRLGGAATASELGTDVHTPEEIHKALRVVYSSHWVGPAILTGLVLWVIGFLLFGKIPMTGSGNAVILSRGTVVAVQSAATGQISRWHVRVGDVVKRGQVLAELEQPMITKQLEQAKQQLEDVRERNRVVEELTGTYTQLEVEAIERKRATLSDRLKVLEGELGESRKLLQQNREENLAVLKKQELNLTSLRELELTRLKDLQDKLTRTEELRQQMLRSEDDVLQARQSVNDQQVRVADLVIQSVKLNLDRLQADDSYFQALNRVAERENEILDLRQQQHDLDTQLTQIRQTDADALFARKLEESESLRNIERLERELAENRQIKSEFAGRILELTVGQWEYVNRGQRFGSIDTHDEAGPLEAVAYFKLKDGKRITPGMKLRLTPAIADRDRFGSVIAEVTSVSSYAVSAEGAAKTVGNASVAAALTKDGHQIEVFARLLTDPSSSGYAWDISHGPEVEMSFGTIASALVNLEERPPISFVIPILQHWKGFTFAQAN